jgi:hypothetical protein
LKIPYLNIKKAFDETKDSFSHGDNKDKILSATKLIGKSVANVGIFALEAGVAVVKNIPEAAGRVANNKLRNDIHTMSDEQIESAKQLVEFGEKAKERRMEKEKEESEARRRLDLEEWYIENNMKIDARIREADNQEKLEKEKKIKEREERQRQNMKRKKEQERLEKEKKIKEKEERRRQYEEKNRGF